ncbi:MAG: hypothetical protein HUN04_15715 [Desulfobacter sp.]|nr:MAG: hypothetical protein HUN04_15715 [Desulfobacter sp.]
MNSLKRLFRTSIVILFATVFLFGCGSNPTDVVKDAHLKLDNSITLGDALEKNKHLTGQTWEEFEDDMGRTIVEFTAKSDIECLSEESCDFIKKYGVYTDVKIQFTVGEDEKFEITYIGTAYNASDELKQMFDEREQKEYFGYTSHTNYEVLKSIYANKPVPVVYSVFSKLYNGERSYRMTSKREANRQRGMAKLKPYVNRVFDIYGDQLKQFFEHHRRVKVLIRSRDENTHFVSIFGESNYMRGYLHLVSADERSVCEVESMYTQKEVVNEYARKTGYPSGLRSYDVKDNPTMDIVSAKLNATVNKEGEVSCGLNGSLEGEYKFAVEIRFFKKGDYIYPYEARFGDGDSVMCSDDKNWWKQ